MKRFVPLSELRRRLRLRTARADATGCREWTGAIQSRGYGSVGIGRSQTALAHRVAYFLRHGAIDSALTIDHLCRNRRCVNPAHMEQVTAAENIRRGESLPARNARKTSCDRGHELTGSNVRHRGQRRECRACQRLAEAARKP